MAVQWTQPPGLSAVRYEAQRVRVGRVAPASLYVTPNATASPPANVAPDSNVTAFVAISTDPSSVFGWRVGGQAIEIRWQDELGRWSPWSNRVAAAGGLSDTLFSDSGRGWLRPDATRVAKWSRTLEDSALATPGGTIGPVTSYETFASQRAVADTICAIYGYRVMAADTLTCR